MPTNLPADKGIACVNPAMGGVDVSHPEAGGRLLRGDDLYKSTEILLIVSRQWGENIHRIYLS